MPGMLEVAHRLMEQDIARCGIMQPYEVGTHNMSPVRLCSDVGALRIVRSLMY